MKPRAAGFPKGLSLASTAARPAPPVAADTESTYALAAKDDKTSDKPISSRNIDVPLFEVVLQKG
jgi:hypothetical protein